MVCGLVKNKTIFKVFDLSIGSKWLTTILEQKHRKINKIYCDSLTIKNIEEDYFNLILTSRGQELDEAAAIL